MTEEAPQAQSAPEPKVQAPAPAVKSSEPSRPARTSARGLGLAVPANVANNGQLVRWMFVYSLPGSDDLHLAAATGPAVRGDAVRLFRQNHPGMGIHEAVPNATPAMFDAKEAEILSDPNHVPISTVADFLPKVEEGSPEADGLEPLS